MSAKLKIIESVKEINVFDKQTISSLEIAELTGKEHRNVRNDIERIFKEVGIDLLGSQQVYKNSQNQSVKVYELPRKECDLIISGYSAKYRWAIINRWHELEEGYESVINKFSEKSLTITKNGATWGRMGADQKRNKKVIKEIEGSLLEFYQLKLELK